MLVVGEICGLGGQAGATDLLLAKRSLGLVGTLDVGHSMTHFFDSSLQATGAFVQQGIVLRFMFMACFLFALTFVEANAQSIFSVKLCRNTKHVGVSRRMSTTALPPVGLLPVVASF